MGEEKNANTTSYGVDSNWYDDSGATDHVTGELDKLAVKDNYAVGDQIYTASGSCMHIKHVGHAIIRTPYRDLKLNHILYVPQSSKNLASVHKITSDNNIFFELHHDFFFIMDRESRKTLLQGRSKTDSKSAVHSRKAKSIVPHLHSSCLTSSTIAISNNGVHSA
jgi:hypothetical protein